MSGTISETTTTENNGGIGAAVGGGASGGTSVGESTSGVTSFTPGDLSVLPPNYASGNLGFFNRQTEHVPTSVTVGPDGALYVGELGAIPYPTGYSRVIRIADPEATTGFDGQIPSGEPQVYASGFSQINGLSFDGQGNLYVLEYLNAATIYEPTSVPAELAPSKLIRVATDGTRETISGPELKLGNYVLADKSNGDVYVSINNADTPNGLVLRYSAGADGKYSPEVVASGLNNPRGLSFGPDGNLYVLEQGLGTPANDPNVANAPSIEFIPGLVSERGGYTGSITRVDINSAEGGQERIFTGLASFREYYPTTNTDRVISIGPNGFTITPDGTVYVASGGGLGQDSKALLNNSSLPGFGEYVSGVVRVDGLFDGNSQDATLTPLFDSVGYASRTGADGATTLFNTQSNLNDIVYRPQDGKLYAVDAARNVTYGLGTDGVDVESATVVQKRPPVLSPPQYGAVVATGGTPSADYAVEIDQVTFKNANGLPDTPGRAATPVPSGTSSAAAQSGATAGNTPSIPVAGTSGTPTDAAAAGGPPPRGEDSAVGASNASGTNGGLTAAQQSGVPGAIPNTAGTGPSGDLNPAQQSGLPGNIPINPAFPGPSTPESPPVLANNVYAPYFEPFFGYSSAEDLLLPAGEHGGQYTVSNLYSFGDRLADDGGTYGAVSFYRSVGVSTPYTTAPYSEYGSLSDGPKWTQFLADILGVENNGQDTNFAFEGGTAALVVDSSGFFLPQFNFQSQIDYFQQSYGKFSSTDLVTVTFGGNDLTVLGVTPTSETVTQAVNAIVDGMEELAGLGARHFLVTNLPDLTYAPFLSSPEAAAAVGIDSALLGTLVEQFNVELSTALDDFRAETGVDVQELDLNKLFDSIVANPSNYGFINVSQPVLASLPFPGTEVAYNPAIVGQDPAVQHATLFLDPLFNPTALGHAVIAETARSTLT